MTEELKRAEEVLHKVPASNEELLAKIEKASERLDAASKRFEKAKLAAEEAKADKILQGVGDAGVPVEKKEESPTEYVDRVMKGDVI